MQSKFILSKILIFLYNFSSCNYFLFLHYMKSAINIRFNVCQHFNELHQLIYYCYNTVSYTVFGHLQPYLVVINITSVRFTKCTKCWSCYRKFLYIGFWITPLYFLSFAFRFFLIRNHQIFAILDKKWRHLGNRTLSRESNVWAKYQIYSFSESKWNIERRIPGHT